MDQPGNDVAHPGGDHPRQAAWRVWSARRIGIALLVVWAVGLVLVALHPLGVLAAALYVALVAWLTAAMGVLASSLAKNSTRALVWTFIVVLSASAATQWPATVWALLFHYNELPGRWSATALSLDRISAAFSLVMGLGLIMAAQAFVGMLLTFGSRRRLRNVGTMIMPAVNNRARRRPRVFALRDVLGMTSPRELGVLLRASTFTYPKSMPNMTSPRPPAPRW